MAAQESRQDWCRRSSRFHVPLWFTIADIRTSHQTTTPATQSRSNPVSGRGLPKTGIFQISAGDYRRFRSRSGQFGSPETDSQFAKARHWRAFLRLQRVKSPGAGLPGWRRSADRTCLHQNSLLTGNFTGNFAVSRLPRPISLARNRCAAVTFRAIPYAN